MKTSPADKIKAFKAKMKRVRENGARVIERHPDGSVSRIRQLIPQPDGGFQWTDEHGNPIPNPTDEQSDDAA